MNNEISKMIKDGYKILNFKRNIDLKTNEEYGSLELKALDGYIKTINVNTNEADEIEKVLFNYLENNL